MLSSVLINISLFPFRRGGRHRKHSSALLPVLMRTELTHTQQMPAAPTYSTTEQRERLEVHIHLTSKEEKNVLEEKEKHLLCNATLVQVLPSCKKLI